MPIPSYRREGTTPAPAPVAPAPPMGPAAEPGSPFGTVVGEFKLAAGGTCDVCSGPAKSWLEHEASRRRAPLIAPRRSRSANRFTIGPSLA